MWTTYPSASDGSPSHPARAFTAAELAAWTGNDMADPTDKASNIPLSWLAKWQGWPLQAAVLALKGLINPQLVTVGATGSQFTSIQAAINSITDAGSTKPYCILVGPGDYNEQITMKDYVHLFGYGQNEEGATVVRINHTGWVIKTASACSITNIRFKLDAPAAWSSVTAYNPGDMVLSSGIQYLCILARSATATAPAGDGTHWTAQTVVKIVDGQGSTINPGRTTLFDCYYEASGDFGASHVKLSENNQATSSIVHASCLVYWRPQTTGDVTAIHSLTGSTDAQGLIFGHFLPTAGFASCTLWKKDDAAAPDEISGLVISREYPLSGTNVNLFVCNNTTGAYPALMYVNEVHGLHFIKTGGIVAGSHPEMIMGQRLPTNLGMAASATAADFDLACATAMAVTPTFGSPLSVLVDGVCAYVGDGVRTTECYFSADGGTTAKKFANVIAGDLLYWVGSVAGYQLAVTDVIDFEYTL